MKLLELQGHVITLAGLEETGSPVVSCYLNVEGGPAGYRSVLSERICFLKKACTGKARRDLLEAFAEINSFLAGIRPTSEGVAVFARGGDHPFFLPLQFRVPVPNWIVAGSTPNIFHLIELKDTYDRYVILFLTGVGARIMEVNLGSVTEEIWTARPDLRQRVGREWTKERYQRHRRERANQFINEQIGVLKQLMAAGGYSHLVLAGDPRLTSQFRERLPGHLAARLIDIVHASGNDRTSDIVKATLQSFVEQEERESLAMVERLTKAVHSHGLAVVGARATMSALERKQAELLLLASEYEPDPGWACAACGAQEVEEPAPNQCHLCSSSRIDEFNVKEEMVRIAGRHGCNVEVVTQSDVLMAFGGVGCLLWYLEPHEYARRVA